MKKTPKITIALFLAFIFVIGGLYIVLPKKEFSETEKRYLAGFPKVSFERVADGRFTSGLEEYLADHTPLRTIFVSMSAYYQLLIGNNGSSGVYKGKDGWLIEKPFARENRLEENTERILTFAQSLDIPASAMIIPTKGSVYADMLPANAMEYRDDEALDRFAELSEGTLRFIDVRKSFSENKDERQLFYKTDHHWTSAGAFLAYGDFCAAMGFAAPQLADYTVESTPGFYGTSYSTSCYTLTRPDTVEIYRNNATGGKAGIIITEGSDETEADNMFFENRLAEGDKYVAFLDGNHSLVRIRTGRPGGTLLLVKDSFAHCLAPFLAEQYSEIIMIDQRYYKKPVSEVIKENNVTELLFVYGVSNLAESEDILLK